MPYVFVRENSIKYWCTIQGLNHNEVLRITSHSSLEIFCCKDFYSNGNMFLLGQKHIQRSKYFLFLAWNVSFQIKYETLHSFSTNQASIRTLLFEKDLKLETQILNWIYILFNVFLILSERNLLQTNFDGGPGYEVFFLFLNKGPHLGWKGPRPARTSRWSCQKSWIFTAHMAQYCFQMSNSEN